MTIIRYYAGDQETLFKEAHVVPPQRCHSLPHTKLQNRVSSVIADLCDLSPHDLIIRHSPQLHVVLLPYLDKNSYVIYVC